MKDTKLRVLYLANVRLPTEKAHGIQIMNTCSALAGAGASVTLVIPTRRNNTQEDPFTYYSLPKNFNIIKLLCPDPIRFGGTIQALAFSLLTFSFVLRNKKNYDAIYSRHESLLFLPSLILTKPFSWESHIGKWNWIARTISRHAKGIVPITKGGRDFYIAKGVPGEKILVAHDGVDIARFSVRESREECRKKLNLPLDRRIVAYTGSIALYEWKGVDILIQAAKIAQDESALFLFVGGSESEVRLMSKKHREGNIRFVSQRPHGEIPYYLKAADALVIPNKRGDDISERFTSPMKLFEYMASGTPIVASGTPSVREVLDEENAHFFKPNNPESLLDVIKTVLSRHEVAKNRARRATTSARRYSWHSRAVSIYSFLKKHA